MSMSRFVTLMVLMFLGIFSILNMISVVIPALVTALPFGAAAFYSIMIMAGLGGLTGFAIGTYIEES